MTNYRPEILAADSGHSADGSTFSLTVESWEMVDEWFDAAKTIFANDPSYISCHTLGGDFLFHFAAGTDLQPRIDAAVQFFSENDYA